MAPIIAISGELGAGKSTLAAALSQALGWERTSTGGIQRAMAQRLGVDVLELNHRADKDPEIDRYIDGQLVALRGSDRPLVIDSRLAWHFLPAALKVHLIVDPRVAGIRVADRTATSEDHEDETGAVTSLRQRSRSERERFRRTYGVDLARLRNYDLVIDTTHTAGVDEIVPLVLNQVAAVPGVAGAGPILHVSPSRLVPTEDAREYQDPAVALVARILGEDPAGWPPIAVGRVGDVLFLLNGHKRTLLAARAGAHLIRAALEGEDADRLTAGNIDARGYLAMQVTRAKLYDWEDAAGLRFAPEVIEATSTDLAIALESTPPAAEAGRDQR